MYLSAAGQLQHIPWVPCATSPHGGEAACLATTTSIAAEFCCTAQGAILYNPSHSTCAVWAWHIPCLRLLFVWQAGAPVEELLLGEFAFDAIVADAPYLFATIHNFPTCLPIP